MKCSTCENKASRYCYIMLDEDDEDVKVYVAHCNTCFKIEMSLVEAWKDTFVEITESEFAMVEALE